MGGRIIHRAVARPVSSLCPRNASSSASSGSIGLWHGLPSLSRRPLAHEFTPRGSMPPWVSSWKVSCPGCEQGCASTAHRTGTRCQRIRLTSPPSRHPTPQHTRHMPWKRARPTKESCLVCSMTAQQGPAGVAAGAAPASHHHPHHHPLTHPLMVPPAAFSFHALAEPRPPHNPPTGVGERRLQSHSRCPLTHPPTHPPTDHTNPPDRSMVSIAPVKWAQRSDSIYVTICLPDVTEEKIELGTDSFDFKYVWEWVGGWKRRGGQLCGLACLVCGG